MALCRSPCYVSATVICQGATALITPNPFAWLMLLLWPVVVGLLYRRLPSDLALIWTVLAGYLILPPAIALNLPVLPDLGKDSIPALAALFMVLAVLRHPLPGLPQGIVGKGLIGLFVLSPVATVLANADPVPIGAGALQGMRIYDSVAAMTNQAIELTPFFLARRYLAAEQSMQRLLMALVLGGLGYSVPIMLESQISPQLNIWIYGYFQHDFLQSIRFGGFRPVVFLPHGLWVAFFALIALVAATALLRNCPPAARPKQTMIALYLAAMLILCKSAGPVLYALALVPLILLASKRMQLGVAALLAVVVLAYPLLRGAHLVPLDQIMQKAYAMNFERGYSLQFRIDNEETLLARALERPWFGWGGYGRNLIYDPQNGQVTSIADGAWIISLGIYGWLGYIAQFGLFALPLVLLGREAWVQKSDAFSPALCAVALILAANMVDLLPNATLVPLTWMIAGAALGQAERLRSARLEGGYVAALRKITTRQRTVL